MAEHGVTCDRHQPAVPRHDGPNGDCMICMLIAERDMLRRWIDRWEDLYAAALGVAKVYRDGGPPSPGIAIPPGSALADVLDDLRDDPEPATHSGEAHHGQ